MKNFYIYLIIFFFLINSSNLYAKDDVAYIDMDFVISNTTIGKTILNKISKKDEQNIKELKLREEEIKKLEKEINQKKNILSKDQLDNEIKKFNLKLNSIKKEKDLMVKEINEIKKAGLSNFYKEVNPIIQSYMESNNINILIDINNVIAGKEEYNISKKIIDEINLKKPVQ